MRPIVLILLAVAGLFGLTGCATMSEPNPANPAPATARPAVPPAPPGMAARTFQRTLPAGAKTEYLLQLPPGYAAAANRRWPLILFLHGAGERGNEVARVAQHGPMKFLAQHPEMPFIVVAPQCVPGEHWSTEALLALLDDVTQRYAVDARRVYLTGLSMGGYGTWNLGTSHPERFAAIAPICGGGELISVLLTRDFDGRREALQRLPIWAFHGAKDLTVPLAESERMVKLARESGGREVELTVYPNAGHDSWTETYGHPRLYEWFLRHQLGGL